MTVTESESQCKPEQIVAQLDGLLEQLKTNVQSAATQGDSFDTVERAVLKSVLEIGHQSLELFIALQGDGDVGAEIETVDDMTARKSEATSSTPVRSIFGNHTIEQFTYSTGKNKPIALKPVSARLSLPACPPMQIVTCDEPQSTLNESVFTWNQSGLAVHTTPPAAGKGGVERAEQVRGRGRW